jgi:hypothetical protein
LRVLLVSKRGPPCTICSHDKRHQIEIGLVHRLSARVLAHRFGVSESALYRHKQSHLSPQIAAAILAAEKPSDIDLEALQASESEGLLAQLVTQRARLQTHSELATELGDVRSAVACERAITSNLELVGKLLGQLVQHHEVRSTSVLISTDYIQLRSVLVNALQPFPEAARAVAVALHQLEAKAASDITANVTKRPILIEAKAAESIKPRELPND